MSSPSLSASRRLPARGGFERRAADRLTMGALVGPSLLLVAVANAYPLMFAAIQATHDGSLISQGDFVGLENFSEAVAQPAFWRSIGFTLIFTFVGVFGSWIVGLSLALLIRNAGRAGSVFRVLLLLPWVVPIVVSTASWIWLTNGYDSPLPALARAAGLGDILFLADPTFAAITVCVFKVWGSYSFMMMMMLGAFQTIPNEVYEAARLDRATRWQTLRLITLPMTARSTYISWVLMAIFSVNDFPTIYLLTGGGPVDATSTLIVYAYRLVFQNFQTGNGVAVAFLMTAALSALAVYLYRRIQRAYA